MKVSSFLGPLGGLGLFVLPMTAMADSQQNTEETTDMPATKHQEQVIEGEVESDAETRARGETVEGVPATEHQEQVLEEVAPAAGPQDDGSKSEQNQQSTQ